MTLTSKQRAYLKSLAADLDPVFQIGKATVTHELIKVTVLKNCTEEVSNVAIMISERTRSELVQVIGRKFVLYKPFKDNPKIVLPKNKKA